MNLLDNDDFKVVFMGTPDFAVPSLDILLKNNINVCAVVTAPDKPAGRGLKIKTSPVKDYAIKNNIPLLQPVDLNSESFLYKLKSYAPTLIIVVAFKILPKSVFSIPPKGSINLHASLLPQYRGAAPINWAIINGEKYTGLTTFALNDKIDTGKILMTKKIEIFENETTGELYDRMKIIGAELLLNTVIALQKNDISPIDQNHLFPEEILKKAPKISRNICQINWNNDCKTIYNLIRGLSPHPAAFTELKLDNGKNIYIKILKADYEISDDKYIPGTVYTDNKSYLGIGTKDGIIFLKEIIPECKNVMYIDAFLRGNKLYDR
jgi:methionyl-tRNA formyltransferase